VVQKEVAANDLIGWSGGRRYYEARAKYASPNTLLHRPRRGTRHRGQRVCLSICLFVCPLAYLKNHTSIFH